MMKDRIFQNIGYVKDTIGKEKRAELIEEWEKFIREEGDKNAYYRACKRNE